MEGLEGLKMAKRNYKNKLDLGKRIAILTFGLIGSMFIIVYSIRWEELGFNTDMIGIDITKWFFAFMLVISGIIFSTLVKSGLLGQWKLD